MANTDVADAAQRIKRAFTDRDERSNPSSDAEFYRGLLKLSFKILDVSVSESKKSSPWTWLGPDYVAPVLFTCAVIIGRWLEERLARYLMKRFNVRMPSIYSVTNNSAFSVALKRPRNLAS